MDDNGIEERINYAHELLKSKKSSLEKDLEGTTSEIRRRSAILERTKVVQADTEKKLKDINEVLEIFENAVTTSKESSVE